MTMTIERAAGVVAAPSPDVAPPRRGRILGLLKTIARHRLAQFTALGGLLFAVAPPAPSPYKVSIRRDRLEALRAAEAARGGLSPDKARAVDQRAIEDEILYREGLRLGLDRNDGIVRQRVVQKVLFLAEEIGGTSRAATEAELRTFFERNRDRWSLPERFRLTHVYAHRREDLALLPGGSPPPGEPSPIPADFQGDRPQVTASFGAAFADAIAALPLDTWSEPLPSVFGWHRVRVTSHEASRPARFEEVRAAVAEAENIWRRQEAVARFLESAFRRYAVEIDGDPLRDLAPSRRVAFRMEPSGEDE
ncbi:MAG: hypothetical protein QM820_50360 [Minicystis sp.]